MAARHKDEVVASTSSRLLLRAWQAQDLERFFDMHRRAEVARWIGVAPLRERAER